MKFSIKDFFSECDQIRCFLQFPYYSLVSLLFRFVLIWQALSPFTGIMQRKNTDTVMQIEKACIDK